MLKSAIWTILAIEGEGRTNHLRGSTTIPHVSRTPVLKISTLDLPLVESDHLFNDRIDN